MINIKCKIDCQETDCDDCATLLEGYKKRCEQMMVFERNRIAIEPTTAIKLATPI